MNQERISEIATSVVESENLFIVDIKVSKNNVITIHIDAMEGINIDMCSKISREIEANLDRETEDFELTVASAGIGYPFRVPQQFLKNINNEVEITKKDNTTKVGVLKEYSKNEILISYEIKIKIEGQKKKQIQNIEEKIFLDDIKEIKDIIKF